MWDATTALFSCSTGTAGAEGLLLALGRCQQLQDVRSFPGIEARTSEAGLDPPRMQAAPSDARKLQELDMRCCDGVSAAAWQRLATARWEKLRKAKFERHLGRRWL